MAALKHFTLRASICSLGILDHTGVSARLMNRDLNESGLLTIVLCLDSSTGCKTKILG